jgi:hypothetical protein
MSTENTLMELSNAFRLPEAATGTDFSNDDLAEEMDGLRINFQRIKIPSGGALQFELPGDNPEDPEYAKTIEGVIVYNHASNAYWPEGSSDADEDATPLCSSVNGKTGSGEPGGDCFTCALNRFGTGANGKGKLKYKTLLTGTLTRNNVNEYFSQYELVYNNSVNMLCRCPYIYHRDKTSDDLLDENNPMFMNPFPAYREGYKLFQSCFLPEKITVFGVGQNTQDVYSKAYLDEILGYTVITRTLEEITGKRIYQIHQVMCRQNESEKELYKIAAEEFYKLEYLFRVNPSARKAAMLRIINQLMALLRICAAPQTLDEYLSDDLPGKFSKVVELLNENQNQRMAVGVRHINVMKAYETVLRERCPNRPLFVVSDQSSSLKQRREVVKRMEQTSNGILLSTQQSLSCAVNFDCIDTCLIPELFWNNAAMAQYYFRFIRYNSTRFKNVYFITNTHTIESNLLKMIMVKEKLNLYMKNQHMDDNDVERKFGIDFDLLSMLSRKEYDQDGHVTVRWGEQKIA